MTEERTLPEGWRWVCFGDVVRQVKQSTKDPEKDGLTRIVGLDHLDSESLPVRRWDELEDLPDGTSFTRIFRAGQVLFGKRRAYQRKVGVADFDGVCSGDILVFEPSGDELLAEFLPYLVQSNGFFDLALGTSAGSLSPRTKWQDLAEFSFRLPPVRSQLEIARALEAFDASRSAIGVSSNAIVQIREAVLQRLEAVQVPTCPLGELATVVSGESWKASQVVNHPADGAMPVIGIKNLGVGGQVDFTEATYVKGLLEKRSLFRLDDLTLVVIRTNGNDERIGNVYRATEETMGAALSAFTFGCRFRESLQLGLAFEYMRGRKFQAWATSLVAGSTGLKNLPIRVLRKVPIPIVDHPAAQEASTLLEKIRRVEGSLRTHGDHTSSCSIAVREHLLSGVQNV